MTENELLCRLCLQTRGAVQYPAKKPRRSNLLELLVKAWAYSKDNTNGLAYAKHDVKGTLRGGQWHTTNATKGVEDCSIIIQGRHVAIEVKTTDKQSNYQKARQAQILANGGIYLIADSFDIIEHLDTLFETLNK